MLVRRGVFFNIEENRASNIWELNLYSPNCEHPSIYIWRQKICKQTSNILVWGTSLSSSRAAPWTERLATSCSAMDSRTSSEKRSSSQLVAFAEPNIFCLDEVRGKGKRPNGVYFNVARSEFLSSYNKASKKMNVVKKWIATGAWSNRHRNFELSLDESSEFGVRPRVLNMFLLSGRHSIVNY